MIKITPQIELDEKDIQFEFIRASGPGGQNVNKVASAVQLRYNTQNDTLPNDVRRRLVNLAGSRVTDDGMLIIKAQRFRSQERNREDALNRLIELLWQAAQKPKPRKKTRPSALAREVRLQEKRRRSDTKRLRRSVSSINE